MANLKESCLLAYRSDKNTAEVLAGYRAKDLVEAKDIMSAFVADCVAINAWRTKRQLGLSQSENPGGWKAVKAHAQSIIDREPSNKAAQVLCGAAVLYNRLSTMIASQKAAAKAKKTEPTAETPQPENSVPVWDAKKRCQEVISMALADADADAEWLRECLAYVGELQAM